MVSQHHGWGFIGPHDDGPTLAQRMLKAGWTSRAGGNGSVLVKIDFWRPSHWHGSAEWKSLWYEVIFSLHDVVILWMSMELHGGNHEITRSILNLVGSWIFSAKSSYPLININKPTNASNLWQCFSVLPKWSPKSRNAMIFSQAMSDYRVWDLIGTLNLDVPNWYV